MDKWEWSAVPWCYARVRTVTAVVSPIPEAMTSVVDNHMGGSIPTQARILAWQRMMMDAAGSCPTHSYLLYH